MNQTPLHYAALHASPSVAAYLISVGANVTLKNKSGRRPIDIARERGHQTVVDALLNCDYEIEQQEKLAATQSYKIALTSTTEKDQNKRKKKPNKKGMNRRLFKAVIKNDLISLEKLLKLGERGGIYVNGTSNRGLSSIYLGTLHLTTLHYTPHHSLTLLNCSMCAWQVGGLKSFDQVWRQTIDTKYFWYHTATRRHRRRP